MNKPNPVTTQRNVVIGGEFLRPEVSGRLAPCHMINTARDLSGSGYIWVKYYNHWHIVANYCNGQVYNGQSQLVHASDESIAECIDAL